MNSIFGNVDDLYLFCSVVEQGSLLAAAKKLELPVSTMSRRLSALEARLGLRLLEKKATVSWWQPRQAYRRLTSSAVRWRRLNPASCSSISKAKKWRGESDW